MRYLRLSAGTRKFLSTGLLKELVNVNLPPRALQREWIAYDVDLPFSCSFNVAGFAKISFMRYVELALLLFHAELLTAAGSLRYSIDNPSILSEFTMNAARFLRSIKAEPDSRSCREFLQGITVV